MTQITGWNEDDGVVEGSIYICEDYAKLLYGGDSENTDLNFPNTYYDEYGINLLQTKRVKLMIESEDGEQEFDELETVEIPQEVIPSRFFLTAE